MQQDLKDRVALITGASSGLGTQFARTLAGAGAAVVLGGRRIERLKDLRSETVKTCLLLAGVSASKLLDMEK